MKKLIFLLFVIFLLGVCPYYLIDLRSLNFVHERENSEFLFHGSTYDEYLADTTRRVRIAQYRPDLKPREIQRQVEAASPFELKPDKRYFHNGKWDNAVILIHGLWDSPYYLRGLGASFQKKGFLVRTVLLPGHGTRAIDMEYTTLEAWETAVKAVFDMTQKEAVRVHMGGFSTGGLLSYVFYLEGMPVKSLFLFSPGNNPRTPLISSAFFLKYLYRFVIISDDSSLHYYNAKMTNGAHQYYRLYKKMTKLLKQHRVDDNKNIPIYTALSLDDTVVDQRAMLETLQRLGGKQTTVVFTRLAIPEKREGSIIYINSYDESKKRLGIDHVSLPISPRDTELGEKSNYLIYLHYYPGVLFRSEKEQKVKEIEKGFYFSGAATSENMKEHTMVILSYNPYFDRMMFYMTKHIDENL